ncbi:uncharacterized protein RJT20DRAFT_124058 [Scheffersomyces xylosifermentans]|uniref:uncharacterized protein n=1 Tax=Scheffersomyces xylosifermentans TaxID=1304137 RepID=UPI00315C54EE
MDDNPLLVRNRFHRTAENESLINDNNDNKRPTITESSQSDAPVSLLSEFLNYFKIHLYQLYLIIASSISRLRAHTPQIDNNDFRSESADHHSESDAEVDDEASLQILKVRKITNDYHLIQNNNINNSVLILQEDHEPSSNVLQQLAQSRFKKQDSTNRSQQYGTSLSLSNNFLKTSAYQKDYTPEPNNRLLRHERSLLDDFSFASTKHNGTSRWRPQNRLSDYNRHILNYYIPSKPMSMTDYSIVDSLIPNYFVERESNEYDKQRKAKLHSLEKSRLDTLSKITPLSNDQLQKVQTIWQSNRSDVFDTNYQIELYFNDLKTLRDGKWLNDNIIDYYLNLIMDSKDQKVFGWTTHFYTNLESKGYQGVARWAKRKKLNLFEKNLVLVPINILNTHWALAVIDNIDKTIKYYDSLSSSGNQQAVSNLKEYMDQEAKRLNVPSIDYELFPHMETPQQSNGFDCGVFACTAAKYISNSKPMSYSQKDMKVIRRRMTYEIISKHLMD